MWNRLSLAALVVAGLLGEGWARGEGGIPLFTGEQGAYQSVWLEKSGVLKLPDPRVRWEGGVMVVMDVPVTGEREEMGYIATRNALRNYRLSLEFAYGEKRFAPRAEARRNNGLLFGMRPEDKLWPVSAELQLMQGEVGDVYLIGGVKAEGKVKVEGEAGKELLRFDPSAEQKPLTKGRVVRAETMDRAEGWNSVELESRGGKGGADAVYRVNGREVNRLWNLKWPAGESMEEGRVALQVEGAEIRFRNVRVSPLSWPREHEAFSVLVFSKTTGFRHKSIEAGVATVKKLGESFGFSVEATEDASRFTAEELKKYKAVVFLNTTGDVLNDEQQGAFEGYIRGGGGFVGVHSATDTESKWAWYGQLVGARFDGHPKPQEGVMKVGNRESVSTGSLPRVWKRFEEWYNFKEVEPGLEVLATVEEGSYQGGKMGAEHPISWQHSFDGGRAWYTALGHEVEGFRDPLFQMHLLGGIQYAVGLPAGK